MKIAITNNIALNGGDAAILLGMVKALRQRFGHDTEFVVTGTSPEVCAELYPEFKWCEVLGRIADDTPYNHIRVIGRLARLVKRYRIYTAAYLRRFHIPLYRLLLNREEALILNEYATSDYIISSGGTYLIEPYGITPQYVDYRISSILGKPLVLYTQSMGPFVRKDTKDRMRWIFNHCQTILLRDQKSADNVRELNIKNSSIVHVVSDAAFALGDIDKMMSRKEETMNQHHNVAISVRDWAHTSDHTTMPRYKQCIADAVVQLIDKGYRIHFFSTCQGIPVYTDDNKIVDDILDIIPNMYHSSIITYREYLPIPEILKLLEQMDFIIATRLHMSILALISGTPVYPIAYEFKTVELYQSLGYDYVDTIDTLEPSALQFSITKFLNGYTAERRNHIYNQVAQYIQSTMDVANRIK